MIGSGTNGRTASRLTTTRAVAAVVTAAVALIACGGCTDDDSSAPSANFDWAAGGSDGRLVLLRSGRYAALAPSGWTIAADLPESCAPGTAEVTAWVGADCPEEAAAVVTATVRRPADATTTTVIAASPPPGSAARSTRRAISAAIDGSEVEVVVVGRAEATADAAAVAAVVKTFTVEDSGSVTALGREKFSDLMQRTPEAAGAREPEDFATLEPITAATVDGAIEVRFASVTTSALAIACTALPSPATSQAELEGLGRCTPSSDAATFEVGSLQLSCDPDLACAVVGAIPPVGILLVQGLPTSDEMQALLG